MRKPIPFLPLLLFVALSWPASAQSPLDHEGHPWWQHAVFYEIYPRSFADSNNDGIGDLPGITSKLDYLRWLGVDAIWIAPMFPSPHVDWGYDISDYYNVDPDYGTLKDMDELLLQSKHHDIRVLLDLVLTYTSDQNKWFQESKSSRINSKRDWYIWHDGKDNSKDDPKNQPQPPNNWTSNFGGPAWKYDSSTSQWYYHYFYPPQPNLNWRNPEVEKNMFDVSRWWYKRGIAGFRLDAVDVMFVDSQLRDNPVVGTEKNAFGDPVEREINDKNQPELHGILQRLRKVSDQYNAVLIGETWTSDIDQLKRYYGEHNDEVNMAMDFMFTTINKLSPPDFRKQIQWVEGSGGWPVYVLSNHDIRRVYDRYGDGQHNDQIAKLMAALYLTLRGTAVMYYGEEIGMENNDPKRPKTCGIRWENSAGPKRRAVMANVLPCNGTLNPTPDLASPLPGYPWMTVTKTATWKPRKTIPIQFSTSIISYSPCGTPTRRCWRAVTSL
jgi:alpha-glucosidase